MKLSQQEKQKIKSLYEDGYNFTEIADMTGMSYRRIIDLKKPLDQLWSRVLHKKARNEYVEDNYTFKIWNLEKEDDECDEDCECYEEDDDNEFIPPYEDWDESNVLVVWDIHCPAELEWYYEFVREQQERFNCWTVIFIWDIIDFHNQSYHERDPDYMWATEELSASKEALKKWYYTFPEAIVTMGNHDYLPARRAKTIGLNKEMVTPLSKLLDAPEWREFVDEVEIDDVIYTHWNRWDALSKAKSLRTNLVQWHLHSKAWVVYHRWRRDTIFWMQVGCWIDRTSKAFDYAKWDKDLQVISCWVVLDNGRIPLVVLMN